MKTPDFDQTFLEPKYVLKWDWSQVEGEARCITVQNTTEIYMNPFELLSLVTKYWGYDRACDVAKSILHKKIESKWIGKNYF